MKIGTKILHTGNEVDPATGAVSIPIYNAATFRQTSVDEFGPYDYSRSGNPTRDALEAIIASLEGGVKGFAFSSGMAAISSVFLLFSPGDHLVACEDVYGGAYRVLTKLFSRLGIEATFVDFTDIAKIREAIRPNTRALYLETPSNPLLKITDLRAVSALAKERGLLSIIDNTFMTPYLQRPIEYGMDIVIHSATKYLGGPQRPDRRAGRCRRPEAGRSDQIHPEFLRGGPGTAGLLASDARDQDPEGADGHAPEGRGQDRRMAPGTSGGEGGLLPRPARPSGKGDP